VSSQPTNNPPERRASKRFRIECDVRYQVIGRGVFEGFLTGKTVNMSSGGVLLATDRVLTPGLRVQLEVDWPVKLNDEVKLKLVIRGKVVRSEEGVVALAGVKISRHTFHTASGRIADR
jgi:hypothetical protein